MEGSVKSSPPTSGNKRLASHEYLASPHRPLLDRSVLNLLYLGDELVLRHRPTHRKGKASRVSGTAAQPRVDR